MQCSEHILYFWLKKKENKTGLEILPKLKAKVNLKNCKQIAQTHFAFMNMGSKMYCIIFAKTQMDCYTFVLLFRNPKCKLWDFVYQMADKMAIQFFWTWKLSSCRFSLLTILVWFYPWALGPSLVQ